MRLLLIAISGAALLLSQPHATAAEEPFLGVWKLNLDKSPAAQGRPQSQVIRMTSEEGMYVMTEDNVTAKGMEYRVTCKLALDGKDYPVTGSIAAIELVSGSRIAPNIVETKAKKKDGTVIGTYWMTLSADGKSRITLSWPGSAPAGPPARVTIHDRQ